MFLKPAIALSGKLRNRARANRKNSTQTEKLVWRELRFNQTGYKFRRQYAIGRYIVDFACPERKLVIELDGGQHMNQLEYDQKRLAWLEGQGYTVLRFWNNEACSNLSGVRQVIYSRLQSTPHLGPPPQGGRKAEE